MLSCIKLFATPWTAACQAPLSMGFSQQEYQNGLPFSPPRGLPNSEIEPAISCIHTHTHTHTQSVIKETKLSQCCNSHYHLQNENDSWCKGNNDQSQLPKVHQENPVKTESSERFCPRCMCMCSVHTTESMVIISL